MREILLEFGLLNLIEGIMYYLYFLKVNDISFDIKNNKVYFDIFVLTCILYLTPILITISVYQIPMIMLMWIYLKFRNDNGLKTLSPMLKTFFVICIVETPYVLIGNHFNLIDLQEIFTMDIIDRFLLFLPVRIIELVIVSWRGVNMKSFWSGKIVKK